jgi:hypothetical protein
MSRNVFPWLLTGGAVAVIVYIGTRPSERRTAATRSASSEPRDRTLRNASLSYRSLGRTGGPYPAWVRALRGKSGVYIIRERQRDSSNPVVYVGGIAHLETLSDADAPPSDLVQEDALPAPGDCAISEEAA